MCRDGGWSLQSGLAAGACATIVAGRLAAAAMGGSWAAVWQKPEGLYARSMRASAEPFRAVINVARMRLAEGRVDEALELAERNAARAPWFARSYDLLGNVWLQKGDLLRARACYEQALRLNPGAAYSACALGVLLEFRLGDPLGAERWYRQVLAQPPTEFHTQAAVNLGCLLGRQKRLEEAIAVFSDSLKRDPGSAPLHLNLGVAYREAGSAAAAAREFETYERLKRNAAPPGARR